MTKAISQFSEIATLRAQISAWRHEGAGCIALVPTMGNLHAGHLALVEAAADRADRILVHIYVNRAQFAPHEDFDAYPRTLEDDLEKLQSLSCRVDAVFLPTTELMFPFSQEETTQISVPHLNHQLCAVSRPHFFIGIAIIINKLLNIIQPDIAVFGEKDFQQLQYIKHMVQDFFMPVEIIGIPTVRESDGLAMSSRNSYMTDEERRLAPQFYAALKRFKSEIRQMKDDVSQERLGELLNSTTLNLVELGFNIDYLQLCDQDRLQVIERGIHWNELDNLIVLAAANLGKTRLVDNIKLS